MKTAAQDLAQLRKFFTNDARQVRVAGVADSVAAGYVRHYGSQFSYAVFYGKQSKPAKHYSAKDEAQAEQRIIEALTQAGKMAERKAEDRQKGRAPFTDRLEGETLYRSYTTAGTAQLIREALKKAFPTVKFSVTSSSFANGSSVDIAYTDGPSSKQVERVYAPFSSGHFNSQEDLYEYHQEPTAINEAGQLARVSYGAKYISDRRSYSPAYGFFLNVLDLRQAPALADQFAAFDKWHSSQRYHMQTSWGEHAGTYSVSSDSSHGDLERFAESLSAQGYAVSFSKIGDELTLSTSSANNSQAAPVAEPVAEMDETDRQYYAAEMQWLADAGQDSTDREFEAAERSWLV
ncbi:LPD29 domain-containing protein [Hymenobacter sp. BRD67]|uniref:LPD29 domain-containing protein n=1 Tax=Hymenobacter sp. BRD67 TaxID=2675877 RepID=UPI00156616D4|nr:LPD29 domain-containing protein [Hymenobacter sp. BRD67]QKG54850.1 hypothetical protein GKZ67_20700 [Hymenobacter sp. BRD67]